MERGRFPLTATSFKVLDAARDFQKTQVINEGKHSEGDRRKLFSGLLAK
jgi:hypothetical protein